MRNGTITYGELTKKLKKLGYIKRRSEVNGVAAQVFEHPDIKGAGFLLRDAPSGQEVDHHDLQKVFLILKWHGLIEVKNPLLN